MTVTTRNPTTVVSSGTWTNVANVYASDAARAALTVSSGSSQFVVSGFGFETPVGTDTIESVAVTVQHFENQTTQLTLTVELRNNNGILIGTGQTLTPRTTEGSQTLTFPALTAAQLVGLRVSLTGAKNGGSGSRTFNVNHVQLAVTHNPPPSGPPTDLVATPVSSSRIDLTWTPVVGTTSVDLERDGVVTNLAASPNQHTGLLASTQHSYRVRSVNAAGPGAWSSLVQATTLPPPNPPSDLAAAAVGTSQINLTWSTPAGATSTDLEIDGVTVTGATSPRQHTGLSANSSHNYRVRAVDAGGAGPWSSIVNQTTWPNPPAPPTDLVATPNSNKQITLTWTVPAGTTSVDLEVDGVVRTNVTSPQLHTGLLGNTSHDYRIRGNNISGAGAWSSIVSATTPLPAPPPKTIDSGGPSTTYTDSYDGETPSSLFDLTIDGGGPVNVPYKIRVNGVYRTIAKFRMNGVDRTVSAFRIDGENL